MLSSPAGILWLMVSVILTAALIALFLWKRRQERALEEFSQQIWRLTREAGAAARVRLDGGLKGLGQLGSTVNELFQTILSM